MILLLWLIASSTGSRMFGPVIPTKNGRGGGGGREASEFWALWSCLVTFLANLYTLAVNSKLRTRWRTRVTVARVEEKTDDISIASPCVKKKRDVFGFDLTGQFLTSIKLSMIELGALRCGWPWLVCKTELNWRSLVVFVQSFLWTPQTSSKLRNSEAQEARSQRHADDTWKGSCKQDGGNTFS